MNSFNEPIRMFSCEGADFNFVLSLFFSQHILPIHWCGPSLREIGVTAPKLLR